jgi:hypothetical protein
MSRTPKGREKGEGRREKGEGRRRRESGEELDSENIERRALAKIERDAKWSYLTLGLPVGIYAEGKREKRPGEMWGGGAGE